jgi:hypothetical protein
MCASVAEKSAGMKHRNMRIKIPPEAKKLKKYRRNRIDTRFEDFQ